MKMTTNTNTHIGHNKRNLSSNKNASGSVGSGTVSSVSTPSNNNNKNSRSSSPPNRCVSPRDPTIRHAGRTHIRGKIRRVWRPRYLELCDSGLVRYYELPPTADVTLPEDSDWDHVHMIPKDSLVIYNARIIDVTTLRDLHVGLPRGSYGFLFRGQRQLSKELLVHHPEPNPPRDYFCAVSTLEEAQTWVIALQWAATVGQELRRPSINNHLSRLECYNPNHQYQQQRQSSQQNFNINNLSSSTANDSESTPKKETQQQQQQQSKQKSMPQSSGRIVVTKVQGYRVVQPQTFHWVVAYEISLLLIQGSKIEERRLLRTRNELVTLCQQLSSQPVNKQIIETCQKLLKSLPQTFASESEIRKSFAIVDRILRHLVLEASLVNAQALKRWLVLDNTSNTSTSSQRLLRIQAPPEWYQSYKENASAITYRHVRSVSARDDYVKRWLKPKTATNANTTSTTSMLPLWILQRPILLFGCIGVLIVLFVPFWKLYQRVMISITMRFDTLVLTWLLAAYIGRENAPAAPRPRTRRTTKKLTQTTSTSAAVGSNAAGAGAAPKAGTASGVVVDAAGSDESAVDDDMYDGELLSDEGEDESAEADDDEEAKNDHRLSSPLPHHPANNGESCWSVPPDVGIFKVRGSNYLQDRIKLPSGPSPFTCRGVDLWLTDNPERHIARHPSVLGGQLGKKDTFLVNFLLPFGNFVAYFEIPPLDQFPEKLAMVWTKFLQGDQQYRDARLKLLPVVMEGPWIVKAAVGNGTAPALLGKVIPLQYFFRDPCEGKHAGIYEVDVIITASSIAKGILSVVKGHTKALTIAFAFIIEAALAEELPETVLCSFQVHSLHLEDCPDLPECNLDDYDMDDLYVGNTTRSTEMNPNATNTAKNKEEYS